MREKRTTLTGLRREKHGKQAQKERVCEKTDSWMADRQRRRKHHEIWEEEMTRERGTDFLNG